MSKSKPVSAPAAQRNHHRVFYLLILLLFPSLLLLTSNNKDQVPVQSSASGDSVAQVYSMFSTIPLEQSNIFKNAKFRAIVKLREAYLLGNKNQSTDALFEYEELEEACRQAFGVYAPSELALLVRGILTANGVHGTNNLTRQQYRLFSPETMGIEPQDDIDILLRFDARPEFAAIREGEHRFAGEKLLELYRLREYYLANEAYVSQYVGYNYNELQHIFRQAYAATAPAMLALLERGTLTAHGYSHLTDSAKTAIFKAMTPAKMGLEIGRLLNEVPK